MSFKKSLAIGALALTLPISAFAASDFKVNGFANTGFSWTDTDEQYIYSDKDGTFSEASFLGLQMRFAPNVDVPLSFVTQLLARATEGWNVDADWAFVQWNASEDLAVNLGRVKLPIFLISEAYDVGITYPWISPPQELYGFGNVPFTTMTGLSTSYNIDFDGSWMNAKLFFGRDDGEIPAMGTTIPVEITSSWGGSLSFNTENLELRLGAVTAKFYAPIRDSLLSLPAAQDLQSDLAAGMMAATAQVAVANATGGDPTAALGQLAALQAQAVQTENLLSVIQNGDGSVEFYSLGMKYDGGSLLLMTEYGHRFISGVPLPKSDNWFVTAGYRMNKAMPHITYAVSDTSDSILINQNQQSVILGLRYDVQPWAALKLELQYTEMGDDEIRTEGPLAGTEDEVLPSTGLFNELPNMDDGTFAGDVPEDLVKLQIAYTMVF